MRFDSLAVEGLWRDKITQRNTLVPYHLWLISCCIGLFSRHRPSLFFVFLGRIVLTRSLRVWLIQVLWRQHNGLKLFYVCDARQHRLNRQSLRLYQTNIFGWRTIIRNNGTHLSSFKLFLWLLMIRYLSHSLVICPSQICIIRVIKCLKIIAFRWMLCLNSIFSDSLNLWIVLHGAPFAWNALYLRNNQWVLIVSLTSHRLVMMGLQAQIFVPLPFFVY